MIRALVVATLFSLSALVGTAQTYPGHGTDLAITVGINAPGTSSQLSTLVAAPSDLLYVTVGSPSGAADFQPMALFAEFRFAPPVGTGFPGVWLDFQNGFIVNLTPSPLPGSLGVPVLPQGNSFLWQFPPNALASSIHIVLQAFALAPPSVSALGYLSTNAVDVLF